MLLNRGSSTSEGTKVKFKTQRLDSLKQNHMGMNLKEKSSMTVTSNKKTESVLFIYFVFCTARRSGHSAGW